MYKFEKYGCLFKYDGIPVYIGSTLITKRHFVKWYPWSWVLFILFLPKIIYKLTTKQTSDNN